MDRIVGIETEYGCLANAGPGAEAWPIRIKNHLFKVAKAGAIDLHYRDYEEPPGNGGFLRNGGRIYIDMGHIEYASPECRDLHEAVAYDLAGDQWLQSAIETMGIGDNVSILRNNIDHETGATFGCHENYLMRRDARFTDENVGALLSFLATRQIFTGAGRVGHANSTTFEVEFEPRDPSVTFQLSQRADYIVNDIYQWVQFNRAIINARDEPLADSRKYRRLHLLLGDSNVSPFATALKLGTTALVLSMVEQGGLPEETVLADAVASTRSLSRAGDPAAMLPMADGRTRGALDLQWAFLEAATNKWPEPDTETRWILDQWRFVLESLKEDPLRLIGAVDWVSKKWLLEMFRESENLEWDDPWLHSLDLEYHQIDPAKSLFASLEPPAAIAAYNAAARRPDTLRTPPADTRAAGRGAAVARLQQAQEEYLINWDSVSVGARQLSMGDPLRHYLEEVELLFQN